MMKHRLNWLACLLTATGFATLARAEPAAEVFSLAPPAAEAADAAPAPAAQPEPAAKPLVLAADDCCAPCCRPKLFQTTVGFRTWFTQGNSDDEIVGPGGLNQFRFRDLEATVYEFNVDTVLLNRFVARADIGFGTIDDGNFAVVNTPPGGPAVPAATINNDDLFYVTADAGYRFFSRGADTDGVKANLDAFVGYQHWYETYLFTTPTGIPVSTDQYTWNSVRLGLRGSLEAGRWSTQARVAYVPWTHFESRLVDVAGIEGYKEKADGGKGVMADFTVSYRVWRGLSLDVGYQVFHLTAEPGTIRFAGGGEQPLDNAHSTRHGLLLGLNYRF